MNYFVTPPIKFFNYLSNLSFNTNSFRSNFHFFISKGKHTLKWAGQGVRQIRFVVYDSGLSNQNFKKWVSSYQAMSLYLLIGGSVFLTIRKLRSQIYPDTDAKNKTMAYVSTFFEESKTITEMYGLIVALSKIVEKPKSYLLPISIAVCVFALNKLGKK